MKKRNSIAVAAALLLALPFTSCGGGDVSQSVSNHFLGDVGKDLYELYDAHQEWEEAMHSGDSEESAWKPQRDRYEKAYRHFLEVKDNAVGKVVKTEVDEGVPFNVVLPLTVKDIDIVCKNDRGDDRVWFISPGIRVVLEGELECAEPDAWELGEKVDLLTEGDSLIRSVACRLLSQDGNRMKISVEISDAPFMDRGRYEPFVLQTEKVLIHGKEVNRVQANGVVGELGIFDLRGPVKQCVVVNEWGNTTRTFDENGFWLTNDGRKLSQVYPAGIKRDTQGRIVKGLMDSDGNGEDYTYDEEGRVTKYYYHYYDDVSTETTTYSADGYVKKRHFEPGGMDMIEPYDETYQNIDVDEHGNWTKRKVTSTDGSTTTQTRKITYY